MWEGDGGRRDAFSIYDRFIASGGGSYVTNIDHQH